MRVSYASLLLPVLAAARVVRQTPEPAIPASSSSIPSATPVSILYANSPAQTPQPTTTAVLPEQLDLRQVAPANPANPAVPVVANPQAGGLPQDQDSVTVQWVETVVGTVHTWVPKTITVKFDAVPSQLPGPGKGVIGMGTLTGEVGVTRTYVEGAAATAGLGGVWGWGVVGAVGVLGAVV